MSNFDDCYISMFGVPRDLASIQDFLSSGLGNPDRNANYRTLDLRILDPALDTADARPIVEITAPCPILCTIYGEDRQADSYSHEVFAWSPTHTRLSTGLKAGDASPFDLPRLLSRRNPGLRIEVLQWSPSNPDFGPPVYPPPGPWSATRRVPACLKERLRGSEIVRRWAVQDGSARLVDHGVYVGDRLDRFRWLVKDGLELALPLEVPDSKCLIHTLSSSYTSGEGRRFLDAIPPSDLHEGFPEDEGLLADMAALDAEFEAASDGQLLAPTGIGGTSQRCTR